ncbi:hypothetical protein CXK91_02530 [Stutzerimonas stutzeri]|uniref:ABC transporter domain-containing protein n=1 Tax=Stutzerimonas stutzeri TaxID=316 RepID=A0A2S4ATT5_STUST|nr:hypothetical protein CXK91_02530 [Stutzerimonas stutzeri]
MKPACRLLADGLFVERSGRVVLEDFRLQLQAGELLVLVGPNGSGKSTALQCMAGLLKPSAGKVHLDGRLIPEVDPLQRARLLAYLPQAFRSQWDLDVGELLRLGASRGFAAQRSVASITVDDELTASLDIDRLLTRRLSQLSGGEHARAAIGWALAARSPILLADEPTAALDIGHQLSLMHYLRRLSPACSMLLVLHDLGLAMRFADRIAVIAGGHLLDVGTPRSIRASGSLERAFDTEFHWAPTPHGLYPVPQHAGQDRADKQRTVNDRHANVIS